MLHFFSESKKKILITKEDIAIVKTQIKDTYTKIMNHEFTQGCGEEDCVWCSFVKSNSLVASATETVE